jgi:hypothetical protein
MAAFFAAEKELSPIFGNNIHKAICDGVEVLFQPLTKEMFCALIYTVAISLMKLAAKRNCCRAILSDDLSMHLRNLFHFVFDSIDDISVRKWWAEVSCGEGAYAVEKVQEIGNNYNDDDGQEDSRERRDSQVGSADGLACKICRMCRGLTTARVEALLFNIDEQLQHKLDTQQKEVDARRASNAAVAQERRATVRERRATVRSELIKKRGANGGGRGRSDGRGREPGSSGEAGTAREQPALPAEQMPQNTSTATKLPALATSVPDPAPAPTADAHAADAKSPDGPEGPDGEGVRAQRERALGKKRFYYFLEREAEAESEGEGGHGWTPLKLAQGEEFAVARLTTPTAASRIRSARSSCSTRTDPGPDPYEVRFTDTFTAKIGRGGKGAVWSGDGGSHGRPLFGSPS